MAGSSDSLHEPAERLPAEAIERHRAIVSVMEEMEAVDWYDQRLHASDDEELAEILAHNRDEEKEHAAMTLEWLRRRDPGWDKQLRTYLFTEGLILEIEDAAEHGGRPSDSQSTAAGSLGVGSLRDGGSL